MKKKILIPLAALTVFLAILFVPIPTGTYKDGGTREYSALTYKIVHWKRLDYNISDNDGVYQKTRVYFFPNNFKSIDKLWTIEAENAKNTLTAKIVSISDKLVTVQAINSSMQYSFAVSELENIGAEVGSTVKVTYQGGVAETYPAQIRAVAWELCGEDVIDCELRQCEYTKKWIDSSVLTEFDKTEADLVITSIYANCFFARYVTPMTIEFKINGKLPDEWCVGDQVFVTFENYVYDGETNREEADLVSVEKSTFELDPNMDYKPVIYLYPEKETEVSVKLTLDGDLTCTYPEYGDGWHVTASPDGTLTEKSGKEYNYLYWEGESYAQYDFSKGFCVKGEDTAEFLEYALEKLGLDRREANEFIVYWLPLMQDNQYNIISFQTDAYTDAAKLDITPAPDTLIRVFMAWKPAEEYTDIEPQELSAPERRGFTAVEWGGTRI